MKIFLAGCEVPTLTLSCCLAGHRDLLTSYYSWGCGKKANDIRRVIEFAERFDCEIILDSGLFSFMYGAGKSEKHDERSLTKYARAYVEFAQKLAIEKLTIVECDAQKIIGTAATNKIRRQIFEKSGLKVMYVWHIEDGMIGLEEMSERYRYISLGCPELRKVFKGKEVKYNRAIEDLIGRIRQASKILPRIHLLGNTVFKDLQFHDIWSSDSTSWLGGVKFGQAKLLTENGFKTVKLSSKAFMEARNIFFAEHPDHEKEIDSETESPKYREYLKNCTLCAHQIHLFQQNLDRRFKWQGDGKKLKGRL